MGTEIHGRTKGDRSVEPDTATQLDGKQHIILLWKRKCFGNDNERKQHFLQHKEKHKSNKEAFMDGSKSIGRKVGFAAVFMNTTRRGALPEEASIHTAEMTVIK